jgi:hypothetical protein
MESERLKKLKDTFREYSFERLQDIVAEEDYLYNHSSPSADSVRRQAARHIQLERAR